ncbi:hypothetical protein TNCV_1418141 [Trichonephila clavipes]|nr:hypothetical protein TNCV_1418141 [Trichonephila clavipes]
MAQNRGTGVREITTPPSQLISCLDPRHTHIRWYLLETYLFPLTKTSQFGYNIYTSTVHNFWPIVQILDGASAIGQDPDIVHIMDEIMIESTNNSKSHRSKDGTVVKIPDMPILTSFSGVLLTIPLPALPVSKRLPSGQIIKA